MSCNWCPPEQQLYEQSHQWFYSSAYAKKNSTYENQMLETFKFEKLNKQKISLKRKSQTIPQFFASRPQFAIQQPLTPTHSNFTLIRANKSFNHIVFQQPLRVPQKKIVYPLPIQHTYTPRALYTTQHYQINKNYTRLVPNGKVIKKQLLQGANLQNHQQTQIQKQKNIKIIKNINSPRLSQKPLILVNPSKIEPIEVKFNKEPSSLQITQKNNPQSIKSLALNQQKEQIKLKQENCSSVSEKDFQNQQTMAKQNLNMTKFKKNFSQNTPNENADKDQSRQIKSLRNLQQIQCKDIQSIANASNSSDRKSQILFSWKEYMQENKKTMSSSDVKFRQKIPNTRLQASAKSIIWQTSRKESYNDI